MVRCHGAMDVPDGPIGRNARFVRPYSADGPAGRPVNVGFSTSGVTTMNLLLATGLACSLIGGLIMFGSHRAVYRTATAIVAGYPRVLAALRAKRHDARFGLAALTCGIVLQALAAGGYAVPLDLWRYPAYAIGTILVFYFTWRGLAARQATPAPVPQASGKQPAHGMYETRRSVRLRDAARVEAASLAAIERRREPRDTGVVFLARDWERRWWSEKFGVSTDVLQAAVRYAGPMVVDVQRHLAGASAERAMVAA